MWTNLANYFVRIITDTKEGTVSRPPAFLKGLLYLLSRIYRLAIMARVLCYRWRLFQAKQLGCVTISVGNITVGGTGKTPVVEMLARTLREEKRKVAILTRGYKSRRQRRLRSLFSPARWFRPAFKVVSTGEKPLLEPRLAGDEAYMLAFNLRGISVISGKNRVQSGAFAVEQLGADTIILDDGFQYLKLARNLDIVLIDSLNPFGNECLLPRGILREPVTHLRRAHCFFLTKADRTHTAGLVRWLNELNPEGLIVECAHWPEYVMEIHSNTRKNLDYLKGKKATVFSAIASPQGFEDTVRELGVQVAGVSRFVDHHQFTAGELKNIVRQATRAGAKFILTTEKDAVRIPRTFKSPIPICYLRVRIEIIRGREAFNDLLSRVCFY